MNILIDQLPTSVEIDGQKFEVYSDFRNMILFELLMQDDDFTDQEKLEQALLLFYPVAPNNVLKGLDTLMWFYKQGKEEEQKNKKAGKKPKENKRSEQVYSFEYDSLYIYAAFLSQYKIDLQDIPYLHWWKFKALFASLKEDNQIVQIMQYRAVEITSKMSSEQQRFYRKMKQLYRLPDNRTQTQKETDFAKGLSVLF